MKIYYINSKNKKIDLLQEPYKIYDLSVFSGKWNYKNEDNTMRYLYKSIASLDIGIAIFESTYEKATKRFDELMSLLDVDSLTGSKGRLYVNDYYIEGYFTDYNSDSWIYMNGVLYVSCKLTTDQPYWIRKTKKSFAIGNLEIDTQSNKLYTYDYPYVYGKTNGYGTINNDAEYNQDIILTIYGPVSNPYIKIGENYYQVRTTLEEKEYLTYDTKKREIYKHKASGDKVKLFYARSNIYENFKAISPGSNIVSWDGSFGFDITVIDERSVPKMEGM